MTLRHPRYAAHLIDALLLAGSRITFDGDQGDGISSARWSFLAGLELLADREQSAADVDPARLRKVRQVLSEIDGPPCSIARVDAALTSTALDPYAAAIAAHEALALAEKALTEGGQILDRGRLKTLCDWEADAIGAKPSDKGSRGGSPTADVNAELLTAYLRHRLADPTVTVRECAQLRGGLGKETHLFSASGDTFTGDFVMRRDMAVNLIPNTCHRVHTEYEVLKAVQRTGFPTPDALWVDTRHELIPGGDFIIMRRSRGISGGTLFGASSDPDPALNDTLGRLLGTLHTLPPLQELGSLTESIAPELWTQPACEVVRRNLRGLLSMMLACPHAPSLSTVAVLNWLIANVPQNDVPACLNHGDVGFHNMLLDQGELTALLDWESAHIGHPAEDLAYLYNAAAANLDWPRLLRAYRDAGGTPPSDRDLLYYRIMMNARIAVSLNIAPSRLLNGEVHDLRLLVAESFMRPRVLKSIGKLIDEYGR